MLIMSLDMSCHFFTCVSMLCQGFFLMLLYLLNSCYAVNSAIRLFLERGLEVLLWYISCSVLDLGLVLLVVMLGVFLCTLVKHSCFAVWVRMVSSLKMCPSSFHNCSLILWLTDLILQKLYRFRSLIFSGQWIPMTFWKRFVCILFKLSMFLNSCKGPLMSLF